MQPFNHMVNDMPASGIRHIMEMSRGRESCLHLEVGQPDFDTPEHILDAAATAAHEGFTRYTPNAGVQELREAIAEKVTARNGIDAAADNVVISAGAVCNMFTALLALTEPGQEVLIPDPAWPNYEMQILSIGAVPVRYPLDAAAGFHVDFDALETAVTDRTKVLLINSPSNPTGAVFSAEEIERLVRFAERHDLYIVSDEVYEDIVFEGEHVSAGSFDSDGRVASVFGFSKSYAVTGLRVGYTVCSRPLADLITKLQEPVISCACGISQKACLAALRGPDTPVRAMVDSYRARRDAVVDILRERSRYLYTPRGAFYILVDISSTGMNSTDFAVRLLDEKNVAVAPGETFGGLTDGFVRVSFATEMHTLTRGVTILSDTINEWSR